MIIHICRLVLVCSLALLPVACEEEQIVYYDPPGPLELDPANADPLARWYTNGPWLLDLRADASYALYPTTNRYRKPSQTGRWDRVTYARVDLQPYQELTELMRMSVMVIDGEQVIRDPFGSIWIPLNLPPHVDEDDVVGTWIGQHGTLMFDPNLQFSYLTTPTEAATRTASGGTWRCDQGRVRLISNDPGSETVLEIVRGDGSIALKTDDDLFLPAQVNLKSTLSPE
ncbi:MAG: hypothetical protein AAF432_08185 [Planctomycetota bacterium]